MSDNVELMCDLDVSNPIGAVRHVWSEVRGARHSTVISSAGLCADGEERDGAGGRRAKHRSPALALVTGCGVRSTALTDLGGTP